MTASGLAPSVKAEGLEKAPEGDARDVICDTVATSEFFISDISEGSNPFWAADKINAGFLISVGDDSADLRVLES